MQDPFTNSTSAVATPGMIPGSGQTGISPDFQDYVYRIGHFMIGGEEGYSQQAELEAILTRSIKDDGNIVIVDRKESISSVTGVYTAVITYLERKLNAKESE